jgi:hypothetical protein
LIARPAGNVKLLEMVKSEDAMMRFGDAGNLEIDIPVHTPWNGVELRSSREQTGAIKPGHGWFGDAS